jgi:alkanesulfonate monooxygenase SsuD/methylene tetrahydromethanopterin reductase-like flavin-dependent oxidoreductase (luciferase family)
VRFGIFYEHQNPRPWEGERAEEQLLQNALEQVEIAERVGIDCVWEVEHHFLEEYSHSSAPEVFLAAASQRTERIRLGHGIVQLPHSVNHPARVAERIATLDLISGGRVEFGTGESSSAAELGGFMVERDRKREMWEDAIDAVTRMFVEEPFAGWDSEFLQMPPRNVVPKPLQKPHPPLWVACSRRETIHMAARRGVGALTFSFVEPEDAGKWVDEYYRLIASEECDPAGFAVNPSVSIVLPMMCHHDEATAIDRGIDGAHFFGYSLAYYYGAGDHHPGHDSIWERFLGDRHERGFSREVITADAAPLGVKIMEQGVGSLRGAIGTPQQITELVRRYESAGVDQVVFVLQAGPNRHEHICESLELFGAEVLPAFAEQAEAQERAKAERLAPAIEAALARRDPPRQAPPHYVIDEQADLARAGGPRRAAAGKLPRRADLGRKTREAIERGGRGVLARAVRGASDRQLERRFGNRVVQRALFTGMAQRFRPIPGFGFEGDVLYELRRIADGGSQPEPDRWTIQVREGRARAVQGGAPDPAVTLRMSIPDFARIAADDVKPPGLFFSGRLDVEGDFEVASRLPEMFGEPSPF